MSSIFRLFLALVFVQCTFSAPAYGQWEFIRGDANDDGLFNIADAVSTLNFLFNMGASNCENSMDANDDDSVNIADGVYILNALFNMGTLPPGPHPTCGDDPTPGNLACVGPLMNCPQINLTCTDNMDCGAGEYCEKAMGDCGGTGSCASIPLICPGIFDPVCGCDGNTYNNGCEANAAGVNVDTMGACVTSCTDNMNCATGEFCMKAAGDCMGTGTCMTIPMICPGIFAPVCGCDGMTYNNDCEANAAGVNVDTTGACVATCTNNAGCAAGEFCKKTMGNCGNNSQGLCEPIPAICPLIFDPVCGCDGNTYNNECEANAAGLNFSPANTIPGVGCAGCADNSACAAGEFCNKGLGNCAGFGNCEPIPFICTLIFDPVCGCDGMSYSNECVCNSAGVSADFSTFGGSVPCP